MASNRDDDATNGLSLWPRFTQCPQWIKQKIFPPKPPPGPRTILVGRTEQPDVEETDAIGYPDNTIKSSKYTLLTFLPKNLFGQFQRVANFYFLCVGIIQFVIDTPVTPLTSILPLIFVITVTAFKQGYEDWLRHKADNEVNFRPTDLVRNGELVTACKSKDIKVGDIVKVKADEEFPCDLVMLSSADPKGTCFITTANLDGETNLKTQTSIHDTSALRQPQDIWHSHIVINCNPPIADLYSFEGVMKVSELEEKPLGLENILLRGARLKNTEYVYGCAVYTGTDSKMALNSKLKNTKFSRVEKIMNHYLVAYMLLLFVECMVCTVGSYIWENKHGEPWYMDDDKDNDTEPIEFLGRFLSFTVLYNYVIPISLYVTVELQKFLGSVFLRWDIEMYDEGVNEGAIANTSDLNEELGQIEYLFSDKTGTLTDNMMDFRQCCINNRKFQEINGALCECLDTQLDPVTDVTFSTEMIEFFQVLTVCHTVRVDKKNNTSDNRVSNGVIGHGQHSTTGSDYEYQASSPDEKAFVEACCRYGIVYHGMVQDLMEVTILGKLKKFKLLHTLPFDPTRKRMSVIIQDEDKNIFLYCKGAEVAMLDRVVKGDIPTTQEMINEYAKLGLRTLTIALRPLSSEEFTAYDQQLKEAQTSLTDRDRKLAVIYNDIETKLTLLGATAVEDKLQDDVPQTIKDLQAAGIKVWVLTGDKEETATNISYSAGHFNSSMTDLRLTEVTSDENCEQQLLHLLNLTSLSDPEATFALIVDGKSLTFALKLYRGWFRQLCEKCVAVLCCRMSPLQKAQVVGLIKESPDKPVTAAIGDGANDVSMIQEADVGLAIMGKEGRQAVRNSDYAFAKFKFLRRIILYHGYLYYNRLAVLVQYFFYKNLAWISGQFFYSFYSAYSQQTLYDPFFLTCYNIAFTSLPILIFGIFEQHRPQEILMTQPSVYRSISRNKLLSWGEFVKWNVIALWHAAVFYFGVRLVVGDDQSIFYTGKTLDVYTFGSLIFYVAVVAINIKLMLETYYWCLPTVISYVLTLVGLIVMSILYSEIFWPKELSTERSMFRVVHMLFDNGTSWLTMVLLVVLALLPDIALRVGKDMMWTHQNRLEQQKAKLNQSIMMKPVTAFHSPIKVDFNQTKHSPKDESEGSPLDTNSYMTSNATYQGHDELSLSVQLLPTNDILGSSRSVTSSNISRASISSPKIYRGPPDTFLDPDGVAGLGDSYQSQGGIDKSSKSGSRERLATSSTFTKPKKSGRKRSNRVQHDRDVQGIDNKSSD